MERRHGKVEESRVANPYRIAVALSEGIDVTRINLMKLKVVCSDKKAAFLLELRNMDESRREGEFTIASVMSWESLTSLLTEKLEVFCTNGFGTTGFLLERIVRDNLISETPLEEPKLS